MADLLARYGRLCYKHGRRSRRLPLGSARCSAAEASVARYLAAAGRRSDGVRRVRVVRETNMTAENVPFAAGDLVVYPSHGVGKITAIETQEIAGHTLSVFVVTFDKDRMTLR